MKRFLVIFVLITLFSQFTTDAYAKTVPISAEYGLCLDKPNKELQIKTYNPVDTEFTNIIYKDRPVAQFIFSQYPGHEFKSTDNLSVSTSRAWSKGDILTVDKSGKRKYLIFARNYKSVTYPSIYITVKFSKSLPAWLDMNRMISSMRRCSSRTTATIETPPAIDP